MAPLRRSQLITSGIGTKRQILWCKRLAAFKVTAEIACLARNCANAYSETGDPSGTMLQKNRRTLSRSRVQTLAYHFEVLWTDCLAGFAMSSTVSFVVGRHESWRAGLLAYANLLATGHRDIQRSEQERALPANDRNVENHPERKSRAPWRMRWRTKYPFSDLPRLLS